jgi:hypothetical protein
MHDWHLSIGAATVTVTSGVLSFDNNREGLMHAHHIPSIKSDKVARSVLVTSKVALSHPSFGSALVADNGVRSARFDPPVPCHKHHMPNVLLWWALSDPPPSYIPSIDLSVNPGSSRYIFLSLSVLCPHHGVRDLPSNPLDARSAFLKEFRDGIAPKDSKLDHGSGSSL